MAKISEYGNYETDKTAAEVEKFKETGVLPVSGKYTDNGNMTTKNVKLSDLVGGGGGDAESLAGHGLYASNDKLTVDTDDTLRIVDVGYLSEHRYKVSVTNAVPPTTDASDGDVLTYKDSDGIVWAAPSGGGGGGNPYTKVSVTANDPEWDGTTLDRYDKPMQDQDIEIDNNTYSVVSNRLAYGCDYEWDSYQQKYVKGDEPTTLGLNSIRIKLPQNTEFPMAVVEFAIYDDNYSSTNDLSVYVGSTKLTRMFSMPYNDAMIVGEQYIDRDHGNLETYSLDYDKIDQEYTTIEFGNNAGIGLMKHSLGGGTKVQVRIFGGAFQVFGDRSAVAGS